MQGLAEHAAMFLYKIYLQERTREGHLIQDSLSVAVEASFLGAPVGFKDVVQKGARVIGIFVGKCRESDDRKIKVGT